MRESEKHISISSGNSNYVLGIDIGGSGVKGAPVDLNKGVLLAERMRVETPQPSTPKAIGKAVLKIKEHFDWHGPIGCGYPGVVRHGVTYSAANVDKKWIGANAVEIFNKIFNDPLSNVAFINDADAAGLAEMYFGAGREQSGVVMMLTVGTGIGTALFTNGHLVPNLEIGHMEVNGCEAEPLITDATRQREDLSWKKWAKRFNEYLAAIDRLFSPDLIIIGGGISKKADKYLDLLHSQAHILPATLLNEAGIIGAALAVKQD